MVSNKKGWLVNDTLTCIPNTKTFWHDLLEWIPELIDKTNVYTPYSTLASKIENDANIGGLPDYIIRNASYFRKINLPVKTISLLQDLNPSDQQQIAVCNSSDVVVCNSPYTLEHYKNLLTTRVEMIPLGVDFNLFKPLNISKSILQEETGVLPNSILWIGANNQTPKGFDIMQEIINKTNYNFCLVMKDSTNIQNDRVKTFNRIGHEQLVKIINACDMLVCTSRIETLHLAGIEASACNLPIVASNVGIYYGKANDKWGRIVHSTNSDDFIKEIKFVKENMNFFEPRNFWLNEGLDINTVKEKWVELIKTL